MFTVNDQVISKFAYEQKLNHFQRLEPFATIDHRCIAVCTSDPVLIITLITFIRARGDSVLILPGGTPLASAIDLAVNAGCMWLFYNEVHQHYKLAASETAKTSREPSLYQYSSGTTGIPKLISRPWHEIKLEIESYNKALTSQGFDFGEAEPVIVSSISHSYGLITGVLSALERETEPAVCFSHNPKTMIQHLRQKPKHLLYAVPALLQVLEAALDTWDLRLNAAVTSGSPLPEPVFERLQTRVGCMIQQYGCTEAGCVSLAVGMTAYDDLGLPLRHIHIPASLVPAEIMINTWNGSSIATGDLGLTKESSRLQYLGRIDDLINVSGRKVQPLEVEQTIGRLSEVAEVVVYRGAHPIQGDIVKAQVVACSTLTVQDIKDWCIQHLPPYKIPVEIQMVQAIPRLPTGKISRRLMEQREAGR